MNNTYKITATNLTGRLAFLKLSVRMLLIPRSTYRLNTTGGFAPLEIPGATLRDVLVCLKVGFWHAYYGASFVVNGRIVLPPDWKYLVWLKGGAA